jgi:hypothetical protein
MSGVVMRHFVKCLFSRRKDALVYQVDEETSERIRRNLSGQAAGFCCFSTLDGRDVAVNLASLDLIHFLWDAASPELRAIEHHPACVYFADRAEPFVFDPEEGEEAFNVFFLLDLDAAADEPFIELTDEDGEIVAFDARRVHAIEMSSALVAEGAPKSDEEVGREPPKSDEARLLAEFVAALDDFEMVEDLAVPYNHMGATITDAVLQAGLRYETTVWPRVQHVMTILEAATTSGFLRVLRERGGEEVVRWTHPEKLGRMEAVAELFVAEGIETEADLRRWLCGEPGADDGARGDADAACRANVAKLAAVRGMGPKTIDYFKILCGEQDTAAIDVHLTRFLERAGVRVRDYDHARDVIAEAAGLLGVSAARLDHSIWTYMSRAGKTW